MTFKLPPLPYAKDALEPHMSAETLELHHGKHHAGYVETLNELVSKRKFTKKSLGEIVQISTYSPSDSTVFNNAAQHWNHSFFWRCMTPRGTRQPDGELMRRLNDAFGDFGTFKDAFVESAVDQFGSGWAWLVAGPNGLEIKTTANAKNPTLSGLHPLLVCDVWEHAYYLDYQNKREKFVRSFIEELVDWDFVAERMKLSGEGNRLAARDYVKSLTEFIKSEYVEGKAVEARDAYEGDEREELLRAEQEGRQHAAT